MVALALCSQQSVSIKKENICFCHKHLYKPSYEHDRFKLKYLEHETEEGLGVSLEERLVDGGVTEEVVDVGAQEAAVPVVGDVAAVADVGDKVLECVPGNLLVFIQIQAEQILAHLKEDRTFNWTLKRRGHKQEGEIFLLQGGWKQQTERERKDCWILGRTFTKRSLCCHPFSFYTFSASFSFLSF